MSLKALRDNCNRLRMYKIWLEGSNDPASLQLLFVSKFIGPIYCQSNYCSKLTIHSFACGRDSNFFSHPPPYLVLLVYASLGGFQMAAQRACSEDGLSLNLWWHPCEASFEVWLKFVRVSGPLYLIHDKNRVQLK